MSAKYFCSCCFLSLTLGWFPAAFAADPVVEYVRISQRPGTKLVDIQYRVTDADGDDMTISVSGYDHAAGQAVPVNSLTGDGANGQPVSSGTHYMVWKAGADWKGNLSDDFKITLQAWDTAGEAGGYLVIDVSAGPSAASYPVSYIDSLPDPIPDEYKTTKIVLRRIPGGTFTMGSPTDELGRDSDETQHEVTLTRDFYIGVFEITQKQWERVTGDWPSFFSNAAYRDTRPVESVSYNDIRGRSAGSGWPANNNVDASSFMGKLRAKTHLASLDLPTEAQWEYACRAGTPTALNSGKNLTDRGECPNMAEVGRYWSNGGSGYSSGGTTAVGSAKGGSYLPNGWGLYDMHGNVCEWCVDWYTISPAGGEDPRGSGSGSSRVVRGGGWAGDRALFCRSASRHGNGPSGRLNHGIGFRVCSAPPGQ